MAEESIHPRVVLSYSYITSASRRDVHTQSSKGISDFNQPERRVLKIGGFSKLKRRVSKVKMKGWIGLPSVGAVSTSRDEYSGSTRVCEGSERLGKRVAIR